MRISDWSSDVCSSDLPIFVGQPHRIAERVDFPLPLGNAGLHLGLVGLRPFELRRRGRILVEGIGIGVDQNAARLPLDQPLEQPLELRSDEHTSELQSLMRISYAVFCLKNKKNK